MFELSDFIESGFSKYPPEVKNDMIPEHYEKAKKHMEYLWCKEFISQNYLQGKLSLAKAALYLYKDGIYKNEPFDICRREDLELENFGKRLSYAIDNISLMRQKYHETKKASGKNKSRDWKEYSLTTLQFIELITMQNILYVDDFSNAEATSENIKIIRKITNSKIDKLSYHELKLVVSRIKNNIDNIDINEFANIPKELIGFVRSILYYDLEVNFNFELFKSLAHDIHQLDFDTYSEKEMNMIHEWICFLFEFPYISSRQSTFSQLLTLYNQKNKDMIKLLNSYKALFFCSTHPLFFKFDENNYHNALIERIYLNAIPEVQKLYSYANFSNKYEIGKTENHNKPDFINKDFKYITKVLQERNDYYQTKADNMEFEVKGHKMYLKSDNNNKD